MDTRISRRALLAKTVAAAAATGASAGGDPAPNPTVAHTFALLKRGRPEGRAEARRLLELALAAARKLRIPEEKAIEKLLASLE